MITTLFCVHHFASLVKCESVIINGRYFVLKKNDLYVFRFNFRSIMHPITWILNDATTKMEILLLSFHDHFTPKQLGFSRF